VFSFTGIRNDLFPDPFGLTFNSNGYVSGVIEAAGGSAHDLPEIRSGYGSPLPLNNR